MDATLAAACQNTPAEVTSEGVSTMTIAESTGTDDDDKLSADQIEDVEEGIANGDFDDAPDAPLLS